MQARELYVFAAADNCFWRRKRAQFFAKGKGAAENVCKVRGRTFLALELRRARRFSSSGVAGDLAFDDGGIHAADSGEFARAENSLYR